MPLFTTKRDTQRQTLSAILMGLRSTMPDLAENFPFLADLDPEDAGRRLGEALRVEIGNLNYRIAVQKNQLDAAVKNMIDALEKSVATPAAITLRELEQTKLQVSDLQAQLDQTRRAIETLHYQRSQADKLHAEEIAWLEAKLADYKRLNARQHLDLVELMGEAYTTTGQLPDELDG